MMETYNDHVLRWNSLTEKPKLDDFVSYDDTKISWGEGLKNFLSRGKKAEFDQHKIRCSLYRPFTRSNLYFDRMFNERVYVFPSIFPNASSEQENRVICCNGIGSEKPFTPIISDKIVNLSFLGGGTAYQCFPFYTYSEDGQNRRENISDWALDAFRQHYRDSSIDKWAIFHYVYGLLHHPGYREKYAANLRRELSRIPYAPDFHAFCQAGRKLETLHVDYEQQPEYPLKRIYTPGQPQDWQVRKMRLNPDKTALIYNDWLTLMGIPAEAFDCRLGNRSALDWVIEQYQVKTDPRSGIMNDPNRPDDPHYILRLIAQVVQVSVETVQVIKELPDLI